MVKNPIKFVRNPNSPQAIQARLDGYQDTSPFESTKYIFDSEARHILIDLTKDDVVQRVNYIISGGFRGNKSDVNTSLMTDSQGRIIISNTYIDTINLQWIEIRTFLNSELPSLEKHNPSHPVPRFTYGSTFGFNASAPGETWVNQGRPIDKIRDSQKDIGPKITIAPDANLDKDHPEDHFDDDFTGER